MSITRRRVARRSHYCGPACKPIKPGDVYLEHTVFPGEDGFEEGTCPWRLAECGACATRYGRGGLLDGAA